MCARCLFPTRRPPPPTRQAVHEPIDAPDEYVAPYAAIGDPTRRVYAGMVAALDEGVGNISATLRARGMYDDSVMVLSNDNGNDARGGGCGFARA